MKKVLFICTGNTCRSPMAEGFFRKAIRDEDGFECIGSAGVAAYEGNLISSETAQLLATAEASLSDFKSRMVTDKMLEEATDVYAMTRSHLSMLLEAFPEYSEKCSLVCDYLPDGQGQGMDVPDPIGMGSAAYGQVGAVFAKAIPAIIASAKNRS